jgi:hypothetical protein
MMTTPPLSKSVICYGPETGLPDVRYIVELGNDGVKEFWSSKSALRLDLGTEMSQDDDGRHIRSYQDRSYQELEVREPFGIAVELGNSQRLRSKHWA